MNRSITSYLRRKTTKEECRDTGMALLLILLLFRIWVPRDSLIFASVACLLVNMTVPRLYHPLALVWLGFSHLLGSIVSRIFLTFTFFLLVTPIGVLRRLMGKDALRLLAFKSGTDSVMSVRNHTFTAADLEKPY